MIRSFVLAAGTAVFCCAVAGCGGDSASPRATGPAQASTVLPNGLTLSLTEDSTFVPVGGGQVVYTETLRNATATPIQATIIGADMAAPHALDTYLLLSVAGAASGPIANDGGPFQALPVPPPAITTVTLQPGQSLSGTATYHLTHADT